MAPRQRSHQIRENARVPCRYFIGRSRRICRCRWRCRCWCRRVRIDLDCGLVPDDLKRIDVDAKLKGAMTQKIRAKTPKVLHVQGDRGTGRGDIHHFCRLSQLQRHHHVGAFSESTTARICTIIISWNSAVFDAEHGHRLRRHGEVPAHCIHDRLLERPRPNRIRKANPLNPA